MANSGTVRWASQWSAEGSDLDTDWASISPGIETPAATQIERLPLGMGRRYYGELGNGTNETKFSPVQIGSDDWASISTGWGQTAGA